MAKKTRRSGAYPVHDMAQTSFRLPHAVADDLDVDGQRMGYGAKGSIIRFGLAVWRSMPERVRYGLLMPWPSTASEAQIETYLKGLWPVRAVRVLSTLTDADRELLLDILEQRPMAKALAELDAKDRERARSIMASAESLRAGIDAASKARAPTVRKRSKSRNT